MKHIRWVLLTGALLSQIVGAATLEAPPTFLLKWGSPGGGPGQFRRPYGLATDAAGNVYVADKQNQRIEIFDGNGNFLLEFVGHHGTDHPVSVAVASDGTIYFVDVSIGSVEAFTRSGTFLWEWGSPGTGPSQFVNPMGIAVDPSGNVFVADTDNQRIQEFAFDGTFIRVWGPAPGGAQPGQFVRPVGVATDHDGNVYVADQGNSRIQKFDSMGTLLSAWPATSPTYLAVDDAGNVYVTDGFQYATKYSPTGTLLSRWGGFGTGDGQFKYPTGITVDAHGNIFVAEPAEGEPSGDFAYIQKFGQATTATTTQTWGSLKARYLSRTRNASPSPTPASSSPAAP